MKTEKGQIPIIVILRVIVCIIGIVLLLQGLDMIKSPDFIQATSGIIRILVGLFLVIVGISPTSVRALLRL